MSDETKKVNLMRAAFLRVGIGLPAVALIVIAPSGKWEYWQGWMYLGTLFIPMFFVLAWFWKRDPALLERRLRTREKEAAQRKIIAASFLYFLVVFALPGLDVRFGWSKVPASASIAADALVLVGYMTFIRVMAVNSYLSRTVEVDAGQRVVSTGPYAVVRHPMYAGVCLLYIASPVALGSYWAVLPALSIVPLLAARILNEEKVLLRDLPGYGEYTRKVRYRLVPGVW